MTRKLFVIVAVLALDGVLLIGQSKPSVQGVWRIAEVTTTGRNATTNKSPQPGIYVFTAEHYSFVWDTSEKPRPVAPLPGTAETKMSDAEMIRRYREWAPIVANSGTYEIKGSTLIARSVIAKSTAIVANESGLTFDFKLDGNTLWLTLTDIIGDRVENPVTVRLVRVDRSRIYRKRP